MHKSESNTPLEQATLHLFPWPADAYPGRLRGMVDLIGKAARDTIVDWRRGRYSTPQWARDRIATELEKRAAAFLATATELRK